MQDNKNIHTYDNGFQPHKVKLKDNYHFYNRNIFFRFMSLVVIVFTCVWLFVYKKIIGFKLIGKKNFKQNKKGNFIVCNHIHNLDCFMITTSLFPNKIYTTILQSNLGFPFFSRYIRFGGAVPIPEDRRQLRKFKEETNTTIKRGGNIIFFAEGSLELYCNHIREFLPGVFHYAYEANATILPFVYTFHPPRGLRKIWRKKPMLHLHILPPYKIVEQATKKDTLDKALADTHKLINDYFTLHNSLNTENKSV